MMSAISLRTTSSFFAFACSAFVLALQPAVAARHAPGTGLRALSFSKAPPDFTYDAGAGTHRLDELVGKPVVLNFWATWCEPCRAELDTFVKLRTTYGDAVPLLTVSYEGAGVARAFLDARHVDLPVVEDPAHTIFDLYSVSALPVTVVLGRDGTVAHVSVGEIEWSELNDAVATALSDASGNSQRLTVHHSSDTLTGNAGTQSP